MSVSANPALMLPSDPPQFPGGSGGFGGLFSGSQPSIGGQLPGWHNEMRDLLGISSSADALKTANMIQGAGAIISIFGSINSAIGTYYAAESQKSQLKQQASAQRFASSMARINARGAEFAAQQTLLAGAREMGRVGMAMGQRRAATAASIAARGGQAGVGSNREIMASLDIVSEIDRLTMDANRIRQAEALRTQAVNYQTQAVMGGVSANNLNTTAGTISPGLGAFTSLMGSAGSLASTWAQNRRFEDMLAALQEGRR